MGIVSHEVQKERTRCANLILATAEHWRNMAVKIRADGAFTTRSIWPPFKKVSIVRPGWERQARQIEDAAGGLLWLANAIRDGLEAP